MEHQAHFDQNLIPDDDSSLMGSSLMFQSFDDAQSSVRRSIKYGGRPIPNQEIMTRRKESSDDRYDEEQGF